MTQRNVEQFLGRLVTDPDLRVRFADDRAGALAAFAGEGHELSVVETEALARLDPRSAERFANGLDARIQRTPALRPAGR